MTPTRYERVRELFLAAREVEPDRRAEFLHEQCGSDAELLREVDALLTSAARSGTFLQTPALGQSFTVGGAAEPARRVPERIGRYRILGVLGEGGMGIVYRAEQEHPRRTVALKVIKPGFQSRETLQRFAHETQVLGWLQHPGIAQVYEAGTADTECGQQPFFAMELVDGRPLGEYAAARRRSAHARLELVAKICDAVQHAHQKGVVHRDLKPGNILVVESEPETQAAGRERAGGERVGQPKILDFGVARATDADLRTTTLRTGIGHLVGTMAYMSPEQVSGDPRALDTRSDVYALGVILFELLTGRVPIDVSQKSIPEAARAIVEEEPARCGALDRRLRGDVETIVAKALEKDKSRRYASASDLAEDIRRYLAQQPIAARPATTFYQLRKFARRNRALVGGLALGFTILAWGLIQTTWERNRALRAEQVAEARLGEAERQRAIAQAVNDFLHEDLLGAANPYRESDRNVTVRAILERASAKIEGRFADQPQVEAAIRQTLGDAYGDLGDHESAVRELERSVALWEATTGPESEGTTATLSRLGRAYTLAGDYARAEATLRRALEVRRKTIGPEAPQTLTTANHLAGLYHRQGRYAEEEALAARTLEVARRVLGEDHETTFAATTNLADALAAQGGLAEAEETYRDVAARSERIWGAEYPNTLSALCNLAQIYTHQERFAEAEPLLLRVLEARRRVLGADHPNTLMAMNSLAVTYKRLGRFEEAEPLILETVEAKRRTLGAEHPDTLVSLNNLGSLYATQGRYAEAEPIFVQAFESRRRVLGNEHPHTRTSLRNLIELYTVWKKPERAAEYRALLPDSQPVSMPSPAARE